MLAENLEDLVKKERNQSEQIGIQKGIQKGSKEAKHETAPNLINMNVLTDAQMAKASGLTEADVIALCTEAEH